MLFDNLHKIEYNICISENLLVVTQKQLDEKEKRDMERNVRNAEKGGTFEVIEKMPTGKKVLVVIDPKLTSAGDERNMLQIADSLVSKPKDKVYSIREEGDMTGVTESAIAFCPEKFSSEEIAGFMRFWHKRIRNCKVIYA